MPDIHDLLHHGAGQPLAPLDMDQVLRRGSQRTRNKRALQAVVGSGVAAAALLTSLALASSGSGPRATVEIPLQDDPAVSAPAVVNGTAAPNAPVLQDGPAYGIVRNVLVGPTVLGERQYDFGAISYDQVTYLPEACTRPPLDHTAAARLCFSNTNPKLRTVPLTKDATIVRSFEGDPPATITLAQLAAYLPTDDGPGPSAVRTWRITVLDGHVTRIEQFVVGGA
jgi:hypothetical protein